MTTRLAPLLLALLMSTQHAHANNIYDDINVLIQQHDLDTAEKRLNEALNKNANDARLRHLLAKVQAWQSNYTESAQSYQMLLDNDPNNTDYMLGLSQLHFWQKQNDQALHAIRRAKQINPDDKEIYLLEVQILLAINTPQSIQDAQSLSEDAGKKFPDMVWPLPAQDTNTTPNRDIEIEAGLSVDSLTNNRDAWNGFYVFATNKNEEQTVYTTLETTHRFNLDDNQLSAGIIRKLVNSSAQLEFTYSPTGRVLAEWSALALYNFHLTNKANGITGYKHSQYHTTRNNTAQLGVELNLEPYRLFYVAYPSHVSGAGSATSHNYGLDYNYGAENFAGCSISSGSELEYDGINPAVVSDISGIRCYGRHWFKPEWALSYSIGHFKQGDFYNRNGILVGLRYNF